MSEKQGDSYKVDYDSKPTKRHRIEYRGENCYFMHIYDRNGGALEKIDIYQSAPGKNTDETISGREFVLQLVNLVIKLGAFRALLEIARKSSLGKRTLAGIVYNELAEYLNTDKEPKPVVNNDPAYLFVDYCINTAFCGHGVDGAEIQEKAIECGLLKPETVEKPCGENCACEEVGADFPCTCYRKTYRFLK